MTNLHSIYLGEMSVPNIGLLKIHLAPNGDFI